MTIGLRILLVCALAGIQTPNLLIRSQMLYSIELRAQYFWCTGLLFGRLKWRLPDTLKLFQPFHNLYSGTVPFNSGRVAFWECKCKE